MDYSASEYSWLTTFNISTLFIDFFASIGWVWDRKIVSKELIAKRRDRTGDIMVQINSENSFIDLLLGCFVYTWAFWIIVITRIVQNKIFVENYVIYSK